MTKAECIKYVEDHLVVNIIKTNGAYTAGRFINPSGGLNHSVGCAQPAIKPFENSMAKSTAQWGVNAILGEFHKGDGEIHITLYWDPANKKVSRPWGCGAGKKGSYNNTHIQWEICEPAGHTYAGGTMINYDVAKNQGYFDRMWKMVVAWNVYCCVTFGYDPARITDHSESYQAGMGSNHSDVMQWLPKHGKSMDSLRAEVKAILAQPDTPAPVLQPGLMTDEDWLKWCSYMTRYRKDKQDNDAGAWSQAARDWCVAKGIIAGIGGAEFNGAWEDFITREQAACVCYRLREVILHEVSEAIKRATNKS